MSNPYRRDRVYQLHDDVLTVGIYSGISTAAVATPCQTSEGGKLHAFVSMETDEWVCQASDLFGPCGMRITGFTIDERKT